MVRHFEVSLCADVKFCAVTETSSLLPTYCDRFVRSEPLQASSKLCVVNGTIKARQSKVERAWKDLQQVVVSDGRGEEVQEI